MGFALWTIRSAQRSSLGPRCVTASDHRVTVTTTHFPIGGLRDSGKLIICLCINISINTIYIYFYSTRNIHNKGHYIKQIRLDCRTKASQPGS